MASRKKSEGQARKAKEKAARVPLQQEQHPKASKSCRHGAPFKIPPACRDFIIDFNKHLEKQDVIEVRGFYEATKETLLKHPQAAQDVSLIELMRSIHVSDGVGFALEGNLKFAAASAMIALALDSCSNFSSPATKINVEFKVGDLNGNDRAIVKWLSKNAPCSCLKQASRDLRKVLEKTRRCYGCEKLVEISKLKMCNGCMMVEYCSEECQKFDWQRFHKDHCRRYSEDKKLLDQFNLQPAPKRWH